MLRCRNWMLYCRSQKCRRARMLFWYLGLRGCYNGCASYKMGEHAPNSSGKRCSFFICWNHGSSVDEASNDLRDNPKRFWSFVKSLKSSRHRPATLVRDGQSYSNITDCANIFNTTFDSKFADPHVDTLPEAPVFPSTRPEPLLHPIWKNPITAVEHRKAQGMRPWRTECTDPTWVRGWAGCSSRNPL